MTVKQVLMRLWAEKRQVDMRSSGLAGGAIGLVSVVNSLFSRPRPRLLIHYQNDVSVSYYHSLITFSSKNA